MSGHIQCKALTNRVLKVCYVMKNNSLFIELGLKVIKTIRSNDARTAIE